MEKFCLNCKEVMLGRSDKKFCDSYCKSAYHYEQNKIKENSLFVSIDKQLKKNRRILKEYNKTGLATVKKGKLIAEGFNPNFFTHYWKNNKNEVYLFCYEFGFLSKQTTSGLKYILVKWQHYMEY